MAKASYVWSGSEWLPVASALPQAHQRGIVDSAATSYTLGVNDTGKAIVFSSSSAITLTIPKELTYNFVIGQTFIVIQKGSGQVTVVAESGATLYSLSSKTKTSGQYAQVSLLKIDSDKWVLSGDLTS
jgi:hypothetical protein